MRNKIYEVVVWNGLFYEAFTTFSSKKEAINYYIDITQKYKVSARVEEHTIQ